MDFMLELSKNIPGIQPFVGSLQSFTDTWKLVNVYFKEHPLNIGYTGTEESRDWISDKVTEYNLRFLLTGKS